MYYVWIIEWKIEESSISELLQLDADPFGNAQY